MSALDRARDSWGVAQVLGPDAVRGEGNQVAEAPRQGSTGTASYSAVQAAYDLISQAPQSKSPTFDQPTAIQWLLDGWVQPTTLDPAGPCA